MSESKVGGLVEKWRGRCPVGDPEDEYSSGYDDALRHCAVELEAALSAHGQPEPRVSQAMLDSQLETARLLDDLEKRSEARREKYGLHGQPVVDERISRAWKLVERWEQPTIDGDTLTKEERLRNMGFAAMLRAALEGATP